MEIFSAHQRHFDLNQKQTLFFRLLLSLIKEKVKRNKQHTCELHRVWRRCHFQRFQVTKHADNIVSNVLKFPCRLSHVVTSCSINRMTCFRQTVNFQTLRFVAKHHICFSLHNYNWITIIKIKLDLFRRVKVKVVKKKWYLTWKTNEKVLKKNWWRAFNSQ